MGTNHKKRLGAVAKAAIIPSAAAAVIVAASGVANAAPAVLPSQGGVTTAAETPSSQGGVTTAPAQPEQVYWVAPPAEYRNVEYQPLANYDYDTNTYTAPTYYVPSAWDQSLHLPTYVEPTAPIIAPRDTLRLGTYQAPQPNWITKGDLDRTNNSSAVIEAQTSTFWRSIGIETTRADRLAAAQVAGGAGGAVLGGAIGGGAGAAVGVATAPGVLGDVIAVGGPVGVAATAMAGEVVAVPILGVVPMALAVDAAAVGVPAAVAGAAVGGALGVAAGTYYGAGDLGEPFVGSIPDIDESAITAQTQETLAQWESTPEGAPVAEAVRDIVAQAPEIDRQAREFVAAQPGGQQVIAQVDTRLSALVAESSLGVAAHMISSAVGAGIQA